MFLPSGRYAQALTFYIYENYKKLLKNLVKCSEYVLCFCFAVFTMFSEEI